MGSIMTDDILTYSTMMEFDTYEERLSYLSLVGVVGAETFGGARFLNQSFYKSNDWRTVRDTVIDRDMGFDLALRDYVIFGKVYVHHMNPITRKAVSRDRELLLNPEFLITCSFETHQAIHFGYRNNPRKEETQRRPGDTTLW